MSDYNLPSQFIALSLRSALYYVFECQHCHKIIKVSRYDMNTKALDDHIAECKEEK